MMKRFLILIIGIILSTGVAGGVGFINNKEKDNTIKVEPENVINEVQEKEDEPINVIIENAVEEIEEQEEVKELTNDEVVKEDEKPEVKKENKQTSTSNKQISNTSNKITISNNNSQPKTKVNNTPQQEPINTEQTKVEEPKKEESKPVENKPVEMPKPSAPVREFKVNQNYINKLRSTITTEVTNNLEQLNKYGITDVSQYQIIVDSSICTCYGGNRNGWTYENVSAYNTFKSSILKGTNMKIYAVDEYYNGEYIQTLCYYGH